jgi:serine/threonine-protein kinase RsbW
MFKKINIESEINNLRIVENVIDEITSKAGITKDSYGKILVSALEAVNNAIVHGNKSDPEKKVEIEIELNNRNLRIKVTDEGKGFRPEEVKDPTVPENIEEINGRGIYLMSHLADSIEYNDKGNMVTIIFNDIIP